MYATVSLPPPSIAVFAEDWSAEFAPGTPAFCRDVEVRLSPDGTVSVRADSTPLRFIRLRWRHSFPTRAKFLGDAWERSYGDLEWRGMNPSRWMPWYFLSHARGRTEAFGVCVRPAAFALWSADPDGMTLWLDVRSGSRGVVLGGRTLAAATVVSAAYEDVSPFDAACDFCGLLCSDALRVPHPVYGGNNWYYAYGRSSRDEILGDCRCIADLCEGFENRPYMVVDDGWDTRAGHGPYDTRWSRGNERFGDMREMADAMSSIGVRPGIWMRPMEVFDPTLPREWMLKEVGDGSRILDPSRPEALELVRRDIRRAVGWGFRLVKHDFTTFDVFRRWGLQFGDWPADRDGVVFADRFRTSAEIVLALYRTIREAAGPDALVLGCNTIGHLAAGLVHISRTGDDTSGRNWERTRRMGVNTLAFRLPQHRRFFEVDADCVGIRGDIPMSLNLQWAELLAKSSTPLFASIRPGILTPDERRRMRGFLELASTQRIHAEPLDWMETATPSRWCFDGRIRRFQWQSDLGERPDFAL